MSRLRGSPGEVSEPGGTRHGAGVVHAHHGVLFLVALLIGQTGGFPVSMQR